MNTALKKTCIALAFFLAVGFVGCGETTAGNSGASDEPEKSYPITLTKTYGGKEVLTVDNTVSRYINHADDTEYLASVLYERQNLWKSNVEAVRYDHQKIDIGWKDSSSNDEYTVYVADNEKFTNAFTYITSSTSVSKEVGFFIPNRTYYYKIVGSDSGESQVDSFVPVAPVRYISADTVLNVRDLGGWKTKDGKTLNYGKIYRGAALNETNVSYLSENAKNVFDYLGIKGEIDLRGEDVGDSETGEKYVNKINPSYPILREGLVYLAYDNLITGNKERAKNNFPKIFEFLANEENYPVYFHCSVGADRTGTLGFILEALLGVEYNTLMMDYELTSFTRLSTIGGTRQRSSIEEKNGTVGFLPPSAGDVTFASMGNTYNLLKNEYEGYSADFQKVVEKYLLDGGVKKAHINKVKEIMLG